MTEQSIVIKLGGSTLGHDDTSLSDVAALQQRGKRVILVHGGGADVTRWLGLLGMESKFANGLRVTGEAELRVVTAVLAGLVNKDLVAQLIELGGRAVGISGVDGGLAHATVTNPSLGRVGEVDKIDLAVVQALIEAGFIPVIAPICWGLVAGKVDLLNVNADEVAADIAIAIGSSSLIYLTDVPGLLDPSGRVLSHVPAGNVEALISAGVIRGGMIPKARACARASHHIPRTHIIGGAAAHTLLREDDIAPGGTTIGN